MTTTSNKIHAIDKQKKPNEHVESIFQIMKADKFYTTISRLVAKRASETKEKWKKYDFWKRSAKIRVNKINHINYLFQRVHLIASLPLPVTTEWKCHNSTSSNMCSNLTANEIETMNCCFACFAVRAINPTGTYNTLRLKGPPFVFISKKNRAVDKKNIDFIVWKRKHLNSIATSTR